MRLERLINPRSVAVVGASERPSIGRSVVENLQLQGFAGKITPVNPKYHRVLGLECRPGLLHLDAPPDVVVFCLSHARVAEPYRLLPEIGAGATVIFDGGFAEAGDDGRRLQEEIASISREAGIALCGPNCMGVLNPARGVSAYAQLVHDPAQLPGNVGLVSQSGSVCIAMMTDTRRFGFSVVVSSGNEAVVTTADYIEYLVDDPATAVIAVFTESVANGERYTAALDAAAAAGKPVVVLKAGRTARARQAIVSHTGGLSGGSKVFSAVLRAHRAIEVDGLDELTEVVAACQAARLPSGNRAAVVTASGGLAELALDAADVAGIELPPLSPADRAAVECFMGPLAGDGNPLDAWGSGQFTVNLPQALAVTRASADFDVVVLTHDAFDGQPIGGADAAEGYTPLLAASAAVSDKPHYQINTRPGLMHRDQVAVLAAAGGAALGGLHQGLAAISRLAWHSQWARRPALAETPSLGLVDSVCRERGEVGRSGRAAINEHDSMTILQAYGVPVVQRHMAPAPDGAAGRKAGFAKALAAAKRIGFPVVLKAVSDEIAHKSERALVLTGIADAAALEKAWSELASRVSALAENVEGVLVAEMLSGGVEVLVGVSRDPVFGLTAAFSLGGIAADLAGDDDTALRPLPLRADDAEAMIGEVRAAPLLHGFRGAPPADISALAECIEAVACFAWAERDRIAEIDLNPVIVGPIGEGCAAADALIVPLFCGDTS